MNARPFTFDLQARMRAAFDLVAPAHDWRASIDAYVSDDALDAASLSLAEIADSVMFFTATEATLTRTGHGWRVRAVGYRNGPAGP